MMPFRREDREVDYFFLCFFFFFPLQNDCKINSSDSWADCVIDSADTLSCVDVYFFPPHLEDVFTGTYVSNVDPLAVNIVAVGVPAANWDTLLSHIIAGIPLVDTWWEQTHWNTWGETKRGLWCVHFLSSVWAWNYLVCFWGTVKRIERI